MEQFRNLNIRDDSDITGDIFSKLNLEDQNENDIHDVIMEDYNSAENANSTEYKQFSGNIDDFEDKDTFMDDGKETDVTMEDPEVELETEKENEGDHSVLIDVLFNPTMQGCRLASGRDFLPNITQTKTAKSEAHCYKEEGMSTDEHNEDSNALKEEPEEEEEEEEETEDVEEDDSDRSNPEKMENIIGETDDSRQHSGNAFAIGSHIPEKLFEEDENGRDESESYTENKKFNLGENKHNNKGEFSHGAFSNNAPRIYINQNNFFRDYDDYAAFRSGLRRRRMGTYRGEFGDIDDKDEWQTAKPIWKTPYVLSTYLQILMNSVIASYLIYQGYLFLKVIKQDVSISVDNRMLDAEYKIEDCKYNYEINKCKIQRLPALERQCAEWEKCMRKKAYMLINYSELIVSIVGSLINNFIESFGFKSFGFLALAALFLYAWNFSCGYVRAKTFYGPHLVGDDTQAFTRKAIGSGNNKQMIKSEQAMI